MTCDCDLRLRPATFDLRPATATFDCVILGPCIQRLSHNALYPLSFLYLYKQLLSTIYLNQTPRTISTSLGLIPLTDSPLTTRLGVCCVLVSFRRVQAHQRTVKPEPFKTDNKIGKLVKPDGKPASEDKIEECDTKIDEYCQKDAYVKQHIFSTIMD